MQHDDDRRAPGFGPLGVLSIALSLSIGWGIRGNFGHEYGAMLPGALAAIAVALASGRTDWIRRVVHFAFLGAVGWSFGGSQSYMQVISYTHSGHSDTVLYGFACLTVLGFGWACFGGAFTALPAFLDRKRLAGLYVPALIVFGAWIVQDLIVARLDPPSGDNRHENPLYWFDTDWVGAAVAFASIAIYCLIRFRVDFGSSLVLHMAGGWWAGFMILVVGLGFRMTPPRGDNWAGCVGMAVGLFVFLLRERLFGVAWAMLVCGTLGGLSFAGSSVIKQLGMLSGAQTNWHSVLEQTYGFLNGLSLAIPMGFIAKRTAQPDEAGADSARWTSAVAATFVLCGVTYVNLIKNVFEWIKGRAIPAEFAGLSAWWWYSIFFVLAAAVVLGLSLRHLRRPLAIVPGRPEGAAQLLYSLLLWGFIIGNFERALLGFTGQRMITEGVVTLNALICTALALTMDRRAREPSGAAIGPKLFVGSCAAMLALAAAGILGDWWIIRSAYGDKPTEAGRLHIRFGPNATVKPAPVKGRPHP